MSDKSTHKDIVNEQLDALFQDLLHPNPNINIRAYKDMYRLWPEQSMQRLIKNLDSQLLLS